jgi:hypothetical protein
MKRDSELKIEAIIKSDPTLNFFINEAKMDVFNSFQVELRFNALKLALFRLIDSEYNNIISK